MARTVITAAQWDRIHPDYKTGSARFGTAEILRMDGDGAGFEPVDVEWSNDLIDVPAGIVAGTPNETVAEYEYAEIESVNGGWADSQAGPDEVVIYAPNFAAPIICDRNTLFEVANDPR